MRGPFYGPRHIGLPKVGAFWLAGQGELFTLSKVGLSFTPFGRAQACLSLFLLMGNPTVQRAESPRAGYPSIDSLFRGFVLLFVVASSPVPNVKWFCFCTIWRFFRFLFCCPSAWSVFFPAWRTQAFLSERLPTGFPLPKTQFFVFFCPLLSSQRGFFVVAPIFFFCSYRGFGSILQVKHPFRTPSLFFPTP